MKNKKNLKEKIHQAVCHMYEMVSVHPAYPFHFPVGSKAAKAVGYPANVLRSIPKSALESFAGVGYHFQTGIIKNGDRVLDIGSGSGTDLFAAAKTVGKNGQVIGIDITDAMINKARKTAEEHSFSNVSIIKSDGEKLPFKDRTFDVVISNGVINLIPDKKRVFKEAYRVLKPGGFLNIADIVLGKAISEKSRENPQLWAECIVGALPEKEYLALIKDAGFRNIKVVDRIDYFANSRSENTRNVAAHYKAHSIVLRGKKVA